MKQTIQFIGLLLFGAFVLGGFLWLRDNYGHTTMTDNVTVGQVVSYADVLEPIAVPDDTPVATVKLAAYTGSHEDWLRAAGIPQEFWWAANCIIAGCDGISGESGWNPNAVNPSSGACGLGQQLPCGKWDAFGAWNDPIAALRAMNEYVRGYGGWVEAWNFRRCVGACWSNRTNSVVYKDHTWY